MIPTPVHDSRCRQQGVGMVEILVAVLILSIGVLGFAGLQLKALKSTGQSFYRSQATILVDDIMSRISVNPGQMSKYTTGWNVDVSSDNPGWWGDCSSNNAGAVPNCSGADLAAWDVKQSAWLAAHLLPQGHAEVASCVGNSYCAVVTWNDTTVNSCDPTSVSDSDCVMLQFIPEGG